MDIVYGRNPVREALRGRRRVLEIFVVEGPAGDRLAQAVERWRASDQAVAVRRAPAVRLTSLAGSEDHQGVCALVEPYPYLDPEALLRSVDLLVALDRVQDPHNLGAIIRTAECAGAGVVIPRHRAAEITPAVVRASAGATEHVLVARVRNLADFLEAAKAAGFWVYGAEETAEEAYSAQDYRGRTCFVLGSEGAGLGKRVASLCDVMVRIPLLGRVESLNVSVSAGILLFEARRQRGVL